MKTLSEWKSALLDARSAYERNKQREFACAIRFAQRKIDELERAAFQPKERK